MITAFDSIREHHPQGAPHTASASADINFSANIATIPLSRSTSSVSNNQRISATPTPPPVHYNRGLNSKHLR